MVEERFLRLMKDLAKRLRQRADDLSTYEDHVHAAEALLEVGTEIEVFVNENSRHLD